LFQKDYIKSTITTSAINENRFHEVIATLQSQRVWVIDIL